jgi:hypothetical protein
VYGTTQKLQNSLHPSMIVTYAFTGSARLVTPSGHVTSSYGLRSMCMPVRVWRSACRDQHRQRRNRLRPDDDIGHARQPRRNRLAFLLRHAAGDRDDRIVALFRRQLTQLSQPRVELFFRALADAAGVDDHDVCVCRVPGGFVASLLEEAGHPLRVVDVHLAAERLDQVFLGQFAATFAFALDFRFRLSPRGPGGLCSLRTAFASSISRADRRRPSVIASPPSIRASSSTRLSPSSRFTVVFVRPRSTRFSI